MPRRKKALSTKPSRPADVDVDWDELPNSARKVDEKWSSEYSGVLLGDKNNRVRAGYMVATNGGGKLENVAGFSMDRAITAGLPGAFRSRISSSSHGIASSPSAQLNANRAGNSNLEFELETVQGADDRVPIPNTSAVPWRSICHLIIRREDGRETYGTGWFAGPSLIVTAGHCVIDHNAGRWATQIVVVPGSNGVYPPPFGNFEPTNVYVDPRWRDDRRFEHDFALLLAPNPALGHSLGWFGVGSLSNPSLSSLLVNSAGYPFDKQFGTLWYNGGRIHGISDHFIEYMIDTEEGQSGGPIFYFGDGEQRIAIGIHTRGGKPNRGVRITSEIYDIIERALK